jgi:hypothetical protein
MPAGNPGPVIPERYAKALGEADPIESQRKAPKRVKKLIRGLSEKELSRKPAPGKWSIKEIIAHLADGEVIIGSRERFVAAQDRALLPGYDQDAFVEHLGTDRAKTKDLLQAFAAVRGANVAMLSRLPRASFSHVGLHSERGEESLDAMVRMYAGHDIIHEEQIAMVCTQLRSKKAKRANKASDGRKKQKTKKKRSEELEPR